MRGIDSLVVFLHGDMSDGGPADYLYSRARRFARPGVVTVAMIRPGYSDVQGNRSSGRHFGGLDNYTPDNVDAVADALARLKVFHQPNRLILVGDSGGAGIAAVILGRHPGLAEGAILAALPADLGRWRKMKRWEPWTRSLSPHRFAARIPAGTRVVALTGTEDGVTPGELAETYVATLQDHGVRARYVPVPRAGHGDLVESTPFMQAIVRLLTERWTVAASYPGVSQASRPTQ